MLKQYLRTRSKIQKPGSLILVPPATTVSIITSHMLVTMLIDLKYPEQYPEINSLQMK